MENKHRIANLKAILKATRSDAAVHREKSRAAHRKLLDVMLRLAKDPAHGHLYFSEVGRLYIEQEREITLAHFLEGSALTLREELKAIKVNLSK